MGLAGSNSCLFRAPGFTVSLLDFSMSSIFGFRSSYMLEYRWLFALCLRSARRFSGAEGKWTPLPPISPPSSQNNCFQLLCFLLLIGFLWYVLFFMVSISVLKFSLSFF